ncbi:MAG: 2'-deoxycytidine 5'-triphosphate deaminase [Nanoarchaeota archaeon]|nr:2'-deoxycytidine 5'-triphosphate deaminase [Nanoarchaeota archaeon]MBU0978025.1 2'-deoxycytidine 5'-triphosphate deaminase [Nanoarchaeota archaeon]
MIAGKQTLNTALPLATLTSERHRPTRHGLMLSLNDKPSVSSALPSLEVHQELPTLEAHLNNGLEIKGANPEAISSIGLDLRVSDEIYQAPCLRTINFLQQLRQLARKGNIKRIDPKNGKVLLEADDSGKKIYYIVSRESIALPEEFNMLVDARSNTGRLAVMCTDRPTVDRLTGKSAPVIFAAQPYAFPIELIPGEDSLVQAIFRYKDTDFMTVEEVKKDKAVTFLDRDGTSLNGSMQFTRYGATLTFHTDRVLVARPLTELPGPIELCKRDHYTIEDFFEVREGQDEVEISPRRFYLLGTRENIRLGNVCGLLSRETPDTGTGLWSHFAGFFWPGYQGPITMECRSESPYVIVAGDPAGYVMFDKMDSPLKEGKAYKGAFQYQMAPKAPKPFK